MSVGLRVYVRFSQTKVHTVDDILLHFRCSSNQKIFWFNITESASLLMGVLKLLVNIFLLIFFDIITGRLVRSREFSLFF